MELDSVGFIDTDKGKIVIGVSLDFVEVVYIFKAALGRINTLLCTITWKPNTRKTKVQLFETKLNCKIFCYKNFYEFIGRKQIEFLNQCQYLEERFVHQFYIFVIKLGVKIALF